MPVRRDLLAVKREDDEPVEVKHKVPHIGDFVEVTASVCGCRPGQRGFVVNHQRHTGLPLVDVQHRGIVSLLPHHLKVIATQERMSGMEDDVAPVVPPPKRRGSPGRTWTPEQREKFMTTNAARRKAASEPADVDIITALREVTADAMRSGTPMRRVRELMTMVEKWEKEDAEERAPAVAEHAVAAWADPRPTYDDGGR